MKKVNKLHLKRSMMSRQGILRSKAVSIFTSAVFCIFLVGCGQDPPTSIYRAARDGDPEALKMEIVRSPTEIDWEDQWRCSAIQWSAMKDDVGCLEVLIDSGAKVSTSTGTHLLHHAATWDSLNVMRWLTQRGVGVEVTDSNGRTPAHYAANAGRIEILQFLRAAGASLDREDDNQFRPLHEAIAAGQIDTIDYLIQAGVDISAKTREYPTPLFFACAGRGYEAAELLRANGAHGESCEQKFPFRKFVAGSVSALAYVGLVVGFLLGYRDIKFWTFLAIFFFLTNLFILVLVYGSPASVYVTNEPNMPFFSDLALFTHSRYEIPNPVTSEVERTSYLFWLSLFLLFAKVTTVYACVAIAWQRTRPDAKRWEKFLMIALGIKATSGALLILGVITQMFNATPHSFLAVLAGSAGILVTLGLGARGPIYSAVANQIQELLG